MFESDARHTKKMNFKTVSIWTILLFFMFLLYSYLSLPFYSILNSPDETSNYFFTNWFIQTSTWAFPYELNQYVGDIIHPRSVYVFQNSLILGSFIGLPFIYGIIGKFIGSWILMFLTPLMTIAAGIAFYTLMKHFFDKTVAIFSFFIFLLHPAIWYYTSRSFMHNMLFIDLLIISCLFLFVYHPKKWAAILAGISMAFAIGVRTSEMTWIAICALYLFLWLFKKIEWKFFLIFCISCVMAFLPFLLIYHQIFDKWCLSSYTCLYSVEQIGSYAPAPVHEDVSQEEFTKNPESITFWKQDIARQIPFLSMLFPFGIVPEHIWTHVGDYGIWIFWFISIPACIGFFVFLSRYKENPYRNIYIMLFFFISCWLFLYYGSWVFVDNINYWEISLGNSYVRYFLPYYLLSIPFAACFFIYLKEQWKWFFILFLGLFLMLSIQKVMWQGSESLSEVKSHLAVYHQKKQQILALTQPNDIIIVERQDKILFPERMVVYDFLENPQKSEKIQQVLEYTPVYYFTYLKTQDILYVNETRFFEYSYYIDPQGMAIHDQFLYQLKKREE